MKTVLLLLGVVTLALAAATPAQALSPCARNLINDWNDGRIDKTYPVRCYREAIRYARSRADIDVYSSLEEDLRRAMLASLRGGVVLPGGVGRAAGPKHPGKRGGTGGGTTGGGTTGSATTGDDDPGGTGGGTGTTGPVPEADIAPAADEEEEDSLPLPLIIVGVIGALLVAAGAATYARRWFAGRAVQSPDSPA